MTDYTAQRLNMVDSQVRPSDVTDRRILAAMLEVPRENYLPPAARAFAYMDRDVPLTTSPGQGSRALMAPRVLAKLIQLLDISDRDTVLDVGGATGYSAAVLARLAGKVIALESDPDLAETARRTLSESSVTVVEVVTGPLTDGVADEAPYDAILINGAVASVPEHILHQLKDGGRLAVVETKGRIGRAVEWRRTGETIDSREVFDANITALPGFDRKPVFQF